MSLAPDWRKPCREGSEPHEGKGSRDRKSLREAHTNVLVGVGVTIAVEEVQEKLEVL